MSASPVFIGMSAGGSGFLRRGSYGRQRSPVLKAFDAKRRNNEMLSMCFFLLATDRILFCLPTLVILCLALEEPETLFSLILFRIKCGPTCQFSCTDFGFRAENKKTSDGCSPTIDELPNFLCCCPNGPQ